jgi:hypothetical protein
MARFGYVWRCQKFLMRTPGCSTWFAMESTYRLYFSIKLVHDLRPNLYPVPRMAFVKQASSVPDSVRPYLEGVAKNLADRLWGPNGPPWGTKLSVLEDIVVALREVLSEKMLHLALQRQADAQTDRPAEYRDCPSCNRPSEPREPEPRLVKTRGGEAEWKEPQTHCPRCRRAFFPSVQEPGHRPIGTQPGGPSEDRLCGRE